jgi:predicted ATPase/DNA-binding XRE family transcriptional regulator
VTSFATLLREYRTARSLTQEELAERARLTAKAVGLLERGVRRRPYPHTVRALADALLLDEDQRDRLIGAVEDRGPTTRATDASMVSRRLQAVPAFGRDEDSASVAALLRAGPRRIVTLTGAGGVGKTTLALAVVEQVRADFPGGVVLVELADVDGADAVLPAIASALGVPEAVFDGTPSALAAALADRRVLLVLDNLEHVVSSAPRLATLAASCPDLVVLATSRVSLRLRAEREVRLAPLAPDAAARLFRDRVTAAGLVLDDSKLTAHAVEVLCERADGLPLALELAASAAAIVGPAALLDRIEIFPVTAPRDLPDRQRSMAKALTWSHDLLSVPARAVLARLSVCVGGFSVAVAEEVGLLEPGPVLAALTELVEHSLVTRIADVEGVARFRLLEPIRQDSSARLPDDERGEARAGLVHAMLEQSRGLVDDLRGAGQIPALRLLAADLGNIRVTFDVLLDDARHDEAAELLWLLWQFLVIRGHARDGRAWVAALRSRPMDEVATARWLIAQSGLEHGVDRVHACELAREALVLARRVGSADLAAEAATLAVANAAFADDPELTREMLTLTDGEPATAWWGSYRLVARAQLARCAGDTDQAERILREAESIARLGGNAFELTGVLTTRAIQAELTDRCVEAAALFVEALELAVASGNTWSMTYILSPLAGVAIRLDEIALAARFLGAAASSATERCAAEITLADRVKSDVDRVRTRLGPAGFDRERRTGREARPEDVLAWGHALRRGTHRA